jgi:Mn2+/Fe2+ NRAMP family transporter
MSEMSGTAAAAAAGKETLGKPRGILFVIVLTIITLGIYHLYWTYKVFEEMKRHTGEGIGGVLGLVIAIVVGIVNAFVLPSEVGRMYARDGRAAPMTGWTGLWILLPIVGWFVWIVKVQGALNRYWESKSAIA